YRDADHNGPCLLRHPFRIRPEGGREYTTATKNAPTRSCNSGEGSDNPTTHKEAGTAMSILPETTDNLNLPPLDTPEQVGAEILWCAREAHELLGSDDE